MRKMTFLLKGDGEFRELLKIGGDDIVVLKKMPFELPSVRSGELIVTIQTQAAISSDRLQKLAEFCGRQ